MHTFAPGPIRRFARSFLPGAVPQLSRPAYKWELLSSLFIPLALACVEGGVVGVIAKKGFGAGGFAIAAITAAPSLANITSVLWTRLVYAKDRVRTINALQLGVVACVLVMAVAPYRSVLGTALLIGAMMLARILITGIVNARADLWAHNYPKRERARVTGNLTIVTTLIICITSMLVGVLMTANRRDIPADNHAYRYVYAAAALASLIGVWAFSHVRWRGRIASIRTEQSAHQANPRALGPRAMIALLRRDPVYRRFMWAQFWIGWPVMAADAPFIISLDDEFHTSYALAISLTQVIPIFVAILVIPMWARFLDRVHIIHFRAYHSWVFVAAMITTGAGLILHYLPLIFAGRIILGVANGGGMLAWNLGHHDFAKSADSALYMGVHVTLTGVRGAFAPFLGTLIYTGIAAPLAIQGVGNWIFFIMTLPTIYGSWMFVALNAQLRRQRARVESR